MLNKELLRDIKWIKEDKNQRLIYLPPFFNLYKSINEKIISKIELEGFNAIHMDNDYEIDEDEYMYYSSSFNQTKLMCKNLNLDLAKHKTLDILALFERFVSEQLALPCISGKTLNKELAEFVNLVYIDGKYFEVGNVKYQNGKVFATFNYGIIDILFSNHLDEHGLILPPRVAPVQVCFLMEQKPFAKDIKIVQEYINNLKHIGINAMLDESSLPMKEKIENKYKEGVPLLVEVYNKNIEKNKFTLINRLNSEKKKITAEEFTLFRTILQDIHSNMYKKLLKYHLESEENGISCCMCEDCLNRLKEEKYDIIIPFMQALNNSVCQICGRESKKILKKYKKF